MASTLEEPGSRCNYAERNNCPSPDQRIKLHYIARYVGIVAQHFTFGATFGSRVMCNEEHGGRKPPSKHQLRWDSSEEVGPFFCITLQQ